MTEVSMAKTIEPVRHVAVRETPEKSVITVMASPQSFGGGQILLVLLGVVLLVLGTFVMIFGIAALAQSGPLPMLIGLAALVAGILIVLRLRKRHLSKSGHDIVVDRAAVSMGGKSYRLGDIGDVRVTDQAGSILIDTRSLALAQAQSSLALQALEVRGTELHLLYGDDDLKLLVGLSRTAAQAAAKALVEQMEKHGWRGAA
jgi:hypothetical protein